MDRKKTYEKKTPKIWEGMDPFQCPVWLISILETCVDGAASLRLKVPLIWQVPSMACRSGDLKKKGDPQDKKMPSKCENMIQNPYKYIHDTTTTTTF